uniref:Uncharacterized protein n=1 Tax=Bactrocera latifrons TaxID=174628 RepID=A0A0K8VYM2_BACLA
MQLFRDNLHTFLALVTACITLSSAQQIFYPALKVNQISVRANGRLNAVSTVALATPLPATRDAQGRRIAQRQTVGGPQVGGQQHSLQVGGQPAGGTQFQPVTGTQIQQRSTPPLHQFGQPVGGIQLQPARGSQFQPVAGPQLQQVGVQFGGGQRVGLAGPASQQIGINPFQQIGGPQRVGVSNQQQYQRLQQIPSEAPSPNFRGHQMQRIGGSGSPPSQQFVGQQVQRGPSAQYFQGQQVQRVSVQQYQQIQAQQLQQYSGQVVHQVGKNDWPVLSSPQIYFNTANWHPYGWQPTNWQHVGK